MGCSQHHTPFLHRLISFKLTYHDMKKGFVTIALIKQRKYHFNYFLFFNVTKIFPPNGGSIYKLHGVLFRRSLHFHRIQEFLLKYVYSSRKKWMKMHISFFIFFCNCIFAMSSISFLSFGNEQILTLKKLSWMLNISSH